MALIIKRNLINRIANHNEISNVIIYKRNEVLKIKSIISYINIKNEFEIIKLQIENYQKKAHLIDELITYKNHLSKTLFLIENHLKELIGIENKLFYEIVVNGLNVTKAVDQVAFYYEKDPSTIWKKYYPNVKKTISEFNKENTNF